MRFDANGNHIRGFHKTHQIHDDVVVDLKSSYPGISDITLNTVLQMVREERMEDFHSILGQLHSFSQEY